MMNWTLPSIDLAIFEKAAHMSIQEQLVSGIPTRNHKAASEST